MLVLLSNDDGVFAPGLEALHAVVAQMYPCVVVAPDRDRSGASSSLTLDRPLRWTRQENGFTSINGTPTDCVHLALNGLLETSPEMVVSGINLGANLGDDVLYSGTVAAALEGRFLARPALALSLCSRSSVHLVTAQQVVRQLLARLDQLAMPPRSILNVNIPDLPLDQLKGFQLTRLGHRARPPQPVRVTDPRGKEGYWISAVGKGEDAGEGTDFHAVQAGYVSLTPLQIDKTHYEAFSGVERWLGDMQ
ncbi:5'/3'-nucleotidase SurE [Aestuariirhabdus litorea]|uniref:5'-nucleotidase SurE n=1 Tax=Aestuariirhabdus litorea TaxID=2528527 RepID=A0A3P3VUG4_9GAMM|nr:5'/3'-nucleotidase SurE [Aestuariirhabdus litorea]RRJ85089.1 5'/3'-nucleotidase SurE [Aestuariirhabdus litorea]RWW98313.1 5'/3'-nucleotidase SurE [Endozoicomonadaceae bacterium GTF-13]